MPSSADTNTADKPVTDIGAQRLARVYAQAILDAAEKAGPFSPAGAVATPRSGVVMPLPIGYFSRSGSRARRASETV